MLISFWLVYYWVVEISTASVLQWCRLCQCRRVTMSCLRVEVYVLIHSLTLDRLQPCLMRAPTLLRGGFPGWGRGLARQSERLPWEHGAGSRLWLAEQASHSRLPGTAHPHPGPASPRLAETPLPSTVRARPITRRCGSNAGVDWRRWWGPGRNQRWSAPQPAGQWWWLHLNLLPGPTAGPWIYSKITRNTVQIWGIT